MLKSYMETLTGYVRKAPGKMRETRESRKARRYAEPDEPSGLRDGPTSGQFHGPHARRPRLVPALAASEPAFDPREGPRGGPDRLRDRHGRHLRLREGHRQQPLLRLLGQLSRWSRAWDTPARPHRHRGSRGTVGGGGAPSQRAGRRAPRPGLFNRGANPQDSQNGGVFGQDSPFGGRNAQPSASPDPAASPEPDRTQSAVPRAVRLVRLRLAGGRRKRPPLSLGTPPQPRPSRAVPDPVPYSR